MSSRGLLRSALACALLSLLAVSVALAAAPRKGKTYSGHFNGNTTETISFKVSKNGKFVTNLMPSLALHCPKTFGGFGGVATKPPKKVKITKSGTFKGTVKIVPIRSNRNLGKEIVTGKFLKAGKEKGTVTSKYKGTLKPCSTKVKYTTLATK